MKQSRAEPIQESRSFKSRWILRSRAAPGPGWVPEPPARLRGRSRRMLCLPRCSPCPTGTIPELPRLSKGSLIPDFIPGGSLGRLLCFNPSSRASNSEQQRSPKDVFTSPASSEEERCLAIHVTRSRALDSQPWECARHSQSHRLLPTSRLPGLDKLCCSPSPSWREIQVISAHWPLVPSLEKVKFALHRFSSLQLLFPNLFPSKIFGKKKKKAKSKKKSSVFLR